MSANILETLILFFINGTTLEFGDELICMATHQFDIWNWNACRAVLAEKIAYGAEHHTYAALLGAFLGYGMAPLAAFWAAASGSPNTAGSAFRSAFGLECLEGSIALLGQLATDGNIGTAVMSLALGLIVGVVRGIASAFSFEWGKSTAFRMRFVLSLCVVVATTLYWFGLLPIPQ